MGANYGLGLPVQASTFAKDIDYGIWVIHAAMFLIFILWGIFFTYLLIRYRQKPGITAQHEHPNLFWSLLPDALVLAFELALIVFYAIPVWSRIKMRIPPPETADTVEVLAEQFAWIARYPGADSTFGRRDARFVSLSNVMGIDPDDPAGKDDIVTVNELHVQLNKPTVVNLLSKDVIHSFFIPEFRVKQDAVPGMKIPVWFEPTMPGRFEIACAQLCGTGHSSMRGDVYVYNEEDFRKWREAAAPK